MQRYSDIVTLINREGTRKLSYETMYYPEFPLKPTDEYIITKRLDRADLIANDKYGDPRLWWVLFRANPDLHYGSLVLPPGIRLRIPMPYTAQDIHLMMQEKQF